MTMTKSSNFRRMCSSLLAPGEATAVHANRDYCNLHPNNFKSNIRRI